MEPFTIVGVAVVVILSITSHEAAHAWVADKLGDPTARELGRVTFNPIPHIDPFLTVILPGILLLSGSPFIFGGAKPVPVRLDRLRHPYRDWALVGAVGPLSNVLMGAACAGLLALALRTGLFETTSMGTKVLSIGIFINVLLAIFNLIPIPPLDGSRVLQYFLTPSARAALGRLEGFGFLIILVLIFGVPPFQRFLGNAIYGSIDALSGLFGVKAEVANTLRVLLAGGG